MRYPYFTADVFTDVRFGGNQLAVLPEAEGLTGAQMQRIAREFNYSETVFVLPASRPGADFRLRIFTPEEELPFAGHPTIGAAFILARAGRIRLINDQAEIFFEAGAGMIPVTLGLDREGRFHAELTTPRLPEFGPPPPPINELAAILGLGPSVISETGVAPRAVSCGLPFLLVPLPKLSAMGEVRIDIRAWQASLADAWASMLCLYTAATSSPEADIHVRVFCPGQGIPEDPATGSAAAALGSHLAALSPQPDREFRYVIEQGLELGRPSRIFVTVDKAGGAVTAVRVGGGAVAVMAGEIEV